MGKFSTYIVVMCGLTLLFHMGGVVDNNPLLDLVLQPEDIATSGLWTGIGIALAALGIVAGIGIGFLTRNVELATISALMITVIMPLMLNFTSVIIAVASTEAGKWISAILFGPTIVMFVFNLIEWSRGQDT